MLDLKKNVTELPYACRICGSHSDRYEEFVFCDIMDYAVLYPRR
jgi:hypothetical protein